LAGFGLTSLGTFEPIALAASPDFAGVERTRSRARDHGCIVDGIAAYRG